MKIQSSEQGVVLVITLIMLSVVTVMAVLFLGVSRRERASVTVTTDHITAKAMTESGFAHAQANIVSRMLTTSNKFNYDFAVSTNFLNTNEDGLDIFDTDFDDFENFNPTNVGYHYDNGRPLSERHQAVNIGNLQFDPRPPVYIQTNSNSKYPLDFRFFLNFNRNIKEYQENGQIHQIPRFDRSGLLHEQGNNRAILKAPNNSQARLKTHMVGDPHWIGVLEYPNHPHSPTNRFIGRFAYLILPEGKSLDLNAIHNRIKKPDAINGDYFVRNQGVGPWEINLAAFLSDLNFNEWGGDNGYNYMEPIMADRNEGMAFSDAFSLLRYRMNGEVPTRLNSTLSSLGIDVNLPFQNFFQNDNVDFFADGPYLKEQSWLINNDKDSLNSVYWGGDLRRAYYDVQELFAENRPYVGFVDQLRQIGTWRPGNYSTYDSYTFYRLLSQLGVDSEADEQAETMMLASSNGNAQEGKVCKLNLNYKFDQGSEQTEIKEWEPRELFLNLADRLLQASVDSNPPDSQYTNHLGQLERIHGKDHFTIGGTYQANLGGTYQANRNFTNSANFSITNFGIQIWPRVHPSQPQYSAGVHQRLQQAANIADIVATNRSLPAHFATDTNGPMQKFPLVFRPQFASGPRIYITNFVEVTNDALGQISRPWRDLNIVSNRYELKPNDNVWGIPWVIAAKKGLPNFNEFGVLTAVELTRKLEINKGSPNTPRSFWRTNQMLSLSVSNLFGVELWNSYTRAYPRSLDVRVGVQSDFLMTNQFETLLVSNRYSNPFDLINISPGQWSGEEFQLPIFANRTMLRVANRGVTIPVPSAIYDHRDRGQLIPVLRQYSNATNVLFPDNGFPVHRIGLSMTNRVRCLMTDPATKRVVDFVNLDFVSGLDLQDLLNKEPSDYWSTNRSGHTNAPTEGVMKQILVSLGEVEESDWNSYVGRGAGRDREEAIDLFRAFLGFRPLYHLSFNQRAEPTDAYNRLRDPRKSSRRQVPFSPSVRLVKYEALQANDPLVHYTFEDLKDNQQLVSRVRMLKPGQRADDLHNLGSPEDPGRKNQRYRPWPSTLAEAANQYNIAHKDPLIRRSDDWQFPTNKFPNIGWLGRVHRGTPWQTIYLKGYVGSYEGGQGGDNKLRLLTVEDLPNPNPTLLMPYDGRSYPFQTLAVDPSPDEVVDALALDRAVAGNKQNILNLARTNWFMWSGSSSTHPTNDWKILELFTTSLNDNASKGLLSVNQAGLAAWSAVFSGVTVQTNMHPHRVRMRDIQTLEPAKYGSLTIEPAGRAGMPGYDLANPNPDDNWQLAQIVNGANGINATRSRFPGGRFRHLGEVLATPALTVQSPFLNWTNSDVYKLGLDDFAVERIPQQVLSLLKADEPRVTIYSYGQSLRPAEGSLRTDPDPIRLLNLCMNYQITGEFAAKRVVRFDGSLTNLNAVVESEIVIPVD